MASTGKEPIINEIAKIIEQIEIRLEDLKRLVAIINNKK